MGDDIRRLLRLLDLKRRLLDGGYRSMLEFFYDLLEATGCAARFGRQGDAEALANLGIFSGLAAAWDETGAKTFISSRNT